MAPYLVPTLGLVALLSAIGVGQASAQRKRNHHWEVPGFDFRRDGVLRTRARAVRDTRARLLSTGQFSTLNQSIGRTAPTGVTASPSSTALTGVLNVPAILFRYNDSPAPLFPESSYDEVLFAPTPTGAAAGRPYTLRSYYSEMSNGLFDIQGSAYGFANLDSSEVWYVGGTSATCQQNNPFSSPNCNGLFSNLAISRMQSALREALIELDAQIDFSQYAVGGVVPLVLFMHQAIGAECGPPSAPENHLWAHRFFLNPAFQTQDGVSVSDYILQPAVGGATSCNGSQIMPIGVVAHETGHGFGVPDLYDTSNESEGIGQWGLMSSGSFTSGLSPSRMEAWSLNELGWVTIAPLPTTGTYTFNAAPFSDTAFYVPVQGANPRGEYFLVENRQRQSADSAVIRIHCRQAGTPPGCGGGLLIWHVDSAQIAQGAPSNDMNAGLIHGLAVVQADAFGNLDASPAGVNCPSTSITFGCSDRGDAGDLYPGTTLNPAFVFRTSPAARKNHDGSFAGFGIDAVQQLVLDNTMSFRIRFGVLSVVRASDSNAVIQFQGAPYNVYRDLLDEGGAYAVDFEDGQISADGRRRFQFQSWSDGGTISHNYVGSLSGGTLTANVTRDFKLIATVSGNGTIQADTAIDLAGTFIAEGRAVMLTATAGGSEVFGGWSGDTVTTNNVLTLPMGRPYTVRASFGALVISTPAARPNGVMGAAYADTLRSTGGTGVNSWTITTGALPQGLTLAAATGVISGVPSQTGNFSFTATVTSGGQSQNRVFTMSVSAPTLATAQVVTHLLGSGTPLTADQIRYLDLLGNNNSAFDIGDFLAWVKATGAPLSAAMLQAIEKEGGRP